MKINFIDSNSCLHFNNIRNHIVLCKDGKVKAKLNIKITCRSFILYSSKNPSFLNYKSLLYLLFLILIVYFENL